MAAVPRLSWDGGRDGHTTCCNETSNIGAVVRVEHPMNSEVAGRGRDLGDELAARGAKC